MKKFAFAAVAAVLLAAPAFAETAVENQADINADVGAIHKDNKAIAKQHGNMAHNRAVKEEAKQSDDVAQQAASSAKLGANHVAVGAKKLEKSVDKSILNNDVDASTSTTTK